ncbi:hypothetical protein B0O99DRAFT_30253 [Bisporella sp. PMI_857]|nr:hypothetical protein B0O99DRAFT_30253 [Bisporella sp. PMI_857]
MSFDYSFSFGPTTPPSYPFEEALNGESFSVGSVGNVGHHSRSSSHVSIYSQDSSHDTINTQLSTPARTPARSPIRQLGPLLLPKIRHQDQEIQAPAKRVKKSPLTTNKNASTFRPSHTRSYTNPETISFMHSDNFPSQTRPMTTLCSPISLTTTPHHERSSSVQSLDEETLGKYGFPYRQMPTYIPSESNSRVETFNSQAFYVPQRTPSPLHQSIELNDFVMSPLDDGMTTTMMNYLTSPNPTPSLVRQLNTHDRDPYAKHFWWDIRQIRPWTSFTPTTISSIPGLSALLNINLPPSSLPEPSRTSSTPETEAELAHIYNQFYAHKLNAALSLSLGPRHLSMRPSKGEPGFVSNYIDDNSQLIYGRGLGRVVGLVKSFDRWNTGMRVEGNHRKVQYLRGLSHLHTKMRENNCRYGFILTEIELVVVRNGSESRPHFGYLEIHTVQLATHNTGSAYAAAENSFAVQGEEEEGEVKMTALLALWLLHMMAKDERLDGQVGWKSEIGAPAEWTRRHCLPKDEWIPAPQLAEKREAKRARGWIWPEDPVGRKELGKRGVQYRAF